MSVGRRPATCVLPAVLVIGLAALANAITDPMADLLVAAEPVSPDAQQPQRKLPPASDQKVEYSVHIRPILKAKCYDCHGPDSSEAGLRLDFKQAAFDGGDSGPVIVPGKSAESKLVHLVAELEPGHRMPPEDAGQPLTAGEIGLLRAWIDAGANWPDGIDSVASVRRESDHWAFQPIKDVDPPQVQQQEWVRGGIDNFILAKLEAEGVKPSPEADRTTLIRRLYLDLHGLPPSPEAVQAFLSNTSPQAYEELVEELLAAPAYGERWARHWLDVARYADSDGYEKDRPRPHAWRWRDWVIDALNRDLPFDRFTIEQIAGDLLGDATTEQVVATGFHRNTLVNREGGTDKEEDRVKRTVDRTNTLGEVWLGLTVGCAQCHTHKYDPLTQREYYQLYAFFNSLDEREIGAAYPEQMEKYKAAKAAFDREHAPVVEKLRRYEREQLPAAQAKWEETYAGKTASWQVVTPTSADSQHGASLQIANDSSILAGGVNKVADVYTIEATTPVENITGVRLEVLPHESLPAQGPGRSANGNFVLTDFQLQASRNGKLQAVPLAKAQADFSQDGWPVAAAVNKNAEDGWAVSPQFGKQHTAVFEVAEDLQIGPGSKLQFTLHHNYKTNPHNIGRFRLSVTGAPRPLRLDGLPGEVAQALAIDKARRSKKQQEAIAKYYRSVDPELEKLQQIVQKHAKQAPQDPNQQIKARAIATRQPMRDTRILIRGDFLSPGNPVERNTPAVLPPLKSKQQEPPSRMDLARWLVSDENPLTSRVTVNRVWQRYFGRGIVPTVNDFGTQGELPSHPGLLDWLAGEFRKNGWSLKWLHRTIVTSATYRQSSAARPELTERDPYNSWLARQNRLRVEAEIVRDLALAASGLLHQQIGGPSVRPPQPPGLDKLGYAGQVRWQTSAGTDRFRRGLYTFFQRTVPYPMLLTFDAPDSNTACTRRERSNTPLQSLTLWNDPVFFQCAQHLGRRIAAYDTSASQGIGATEQRLEYAFLVCFAREPSADELAVARDLYEQQLALCRQDAEASKQIVGSTPVPENVSIPDLAAWVMVGRTLLNLDEFITKE